MKRENAVFDQVLKASPEEFIKAWVTEVAATGNASGTAQNDARELLAAIQANVASDADLNRLDDAAWGDRKSVV